MFESLRANEDVQFISGNRSVLKQRIEDITKKAKCLSVDRDEFVIGAILRHLGLRDDGVWELEHAVRQLINDDIVAQATQFIEDNVDVCNAVIMCKTYKCNADANNKSVKSNTLSKIHCERMLEDDIHVEFNTSKKKYQVETKTNDGVDTALRSADIYLKDENSYANVEISANIYSIVQLIIYMTIVAKIDNNGLEVRQAILEALNDYSKLGVGSETEYMWRLDTDNEDGSWNRLSELLTRDGYIEKGKCIDLNSKRIIVNKGDEPEWT